jgi:predicted enzyme related to lactoylglutathione lyase
MGQPVVHFEIIGTDAAKLRNYYTELFGWEFDMGGTRVMGPDGTPGTFVVGQFTDPEGNLIGVAGTS